MPSGKSLAATLASLGFAAPALIVAHVAQGAPKVAQCNRKFSDEDVRQQLIAQKFEAPDALIQVNWKDCIYYIVAWPQPITPDAQRIYAMDAGGHINKRSPL